MATTTKIEWCDATFNPWIGCTPLGPPCDHCYARVSTPVRAMHIEWGQGKPRHRTSEATWKQPVIWERQHEQFFKEHGHRRRVFCASLADVFDNEVDPQWRADLWALIRQTPHLIWMLLTKRVGNVPSMLPPDWPHIVAGGYRHAGYPNVMIGITVADRAEAIRDLPKLYRFGARWKFISYEPALGPLDVEYPEEIWPDGPPMCCSGYDCGCRGMPVDPPLIHGVDLLIAGGESGTDARPAELQWFRSLRDQCKAARVPFFMKQLGGVRDKRGNLEDLPEDLRIREFPEISA